MSPIAEPAYATEYSDQSLTAKEPYNESNSEITISNSLTLNAPPILSWHVKSLPFLPCCSDVHWLDYLGTNKYSVVSGENWFRSVERWKGGRKGER